ncbi:hypothetical protein GCM10009127_14860 [Alteraurantiacibacter aestuarii]|uniref:Uncharacterized protein n=1 Tax=Alteraurantiacibacter aestuarii TaxID=650004 RepID=A0A844ZM67_9SPHN|nr:hypothetical protein [Alteraurantiacibacter aestuarii]MXO87927.1 hypothetical protein [Alteraurantiacibacter aestuarii]
MRSRSIPFTGSITGRIIGTLFALGASLLAAGCATPQEYPSLAVRDMERFSGSMLPAPVFTPAPTAPATLAQLASLTETARTAHAGFLTAVQTARSRVQPARGAAVGSESWSVAQVALADLESKRSNALIALADIDRLYVDAAVEGGEIARIGAARDDISALVDEQNQLIAGLVDSLNS